MAAAAAGAAAAAISGANNVFTHEDLSVIGGQQVLSCLDYGCMGVDRKYITL